MTHIAVFSFDDGTIHDRELTARLNALGVRATFNLNSGFFGQSDRLTQGGREMDHSHVTAEEAPALYRGHEIAVHTRTHPYLPHLPDGEVIAQIEDDRRRLEQIFGAPVRSMAYPGGGENSDARIASLVRRHTPIDCARAYLPTYSHALPADWLLWHPTCHVRDARADAAIDAFLGDAEGGILFLWAHAYNLHYENLWGTLERQIGRLLAHGIPILPMHEAWEAMHTQRGHQENGCSSDANVNLPGAR